MTFVRAICTSCQQDVHLPLSSVQLLICDNSNEDDLLTYQYVLRCSNCDAYRVTSCSARIAQLLLGAGVQVRHWLLPVATPNTHAGETFTYDDLLDFHVQLDEEDWFDKFVQSQ